MSKSHFSGRNLAKIRQQKKHWMIMGVQYQDHQSGMYNNFFNKKVSTQYQDQVGMKIWKCAQFHQDQVGMIVFKSTQYHQDQAGMKSV